MFPFLYEKGTPIVSGLQACTHSPVTSCIWQGFKICRNLLNKNGLSLRKSTSKLAVHNCRPAGTLLYNMKKTIALELNMIKKQNYWT
jgi:hypothetical protein